jgi:hypothetical protein
MHDYGVIFFEIIDVSCVYRMQACIGEKGDLKWIIQV